MNSDLTKRMVRIGVITTLAAIVANFLPAIYLAVFLGIVPPLGDLFQLWLLALAAFGGTWVIQPISFYPILGLGASYIAWVCGNVADIRVPAIVMAQKMTGVKPDTPEGDVIGMIGVAGSVFVSVAILTVFVFVGVTIVPMLPKVIVKSFAFILPAVFGAIYGQVSFKDPKLGAIILPLGIFVVWVAPKIGLPGALVSVVVIIAGMLLARAQYSLDNKGDTSKS